MIYSFRGADVSGVIRFMKQNRLTVLNMGRNFRSTQTIVKAADEVVCHNTVRIDKEVFTTNEEGDNILYCVTQDEKKEAITVANLILAYRRMKGYKYSDIAVLYRMNKQSRIIEQTLLQNNIPYYMKSGVSFYKRAEIKDMLAYLKLTLNSKDQEAFKRIANVPIRGIGLKSVDKILEYMTQKQCSAHFACTQVKVTNSKVQQGLNNLVSVFEELDYMVEEGYKPSEILQKLIVLLKYRDHLANTTETQEQLMQKNGNLDELLKLSYEYDTIAEFMDMVMSFTDDEEQGQSQDKVNLMTIHGAKGLEWPLVIVVGCNEGTMPSALALTDPASIEEERRIAYVAMTRAQKNLVLTRAKYVFNKNHVPTVARESRFISEMDQHFLVRR